MSPSAKNAVLNRWEETQLWNFLFGDLVESDPFFRSQIEDGIKHALAEKGLSETETTRTFWEALLDLRAKWDLPPVGLGYLNLRHSPFSGDPLFLRSEAIKVMKSIAPFSLSAVVVEGLRHSARTPSRYWSRGAQIRYAERLALLREVIRRYSRSSAQVRLFLLEPSATVSR